MVIIEPIEPVPSGTRTCTYIKFDSAPTSNSDYDASAISNAGLQLGSLTTYSNKTSVWVWGSSSIAGQIRINGTTYTGGYYYTSAVEIQLTGNYDIALGYGLSSGGSTN